MNRVLIFFIIMLFVGVGIKVASSDNKADLIVVFLCGGAIGAFIEQGRRRGFGRS
jgi:hypothetical protein